MENFKTKGQLTKEILYWEDSIKRTKKWIIDNRRKMLTRNTIGEKKEILEEIKEDFKDLKCHEKRMSNLRQDLIKRYKKSRLSDYK